MLIKLVNEFKFVRNFWRSNGALDFGTLRARQSAVVALSRGLNAAQIRLALKELNRRLNLDQYPELYLGM